MLRIPFKSALAGAVLCIGLSGACGVYAAVACEQQGEPLRIAVAAFRMETCTFCPRPTDIEHFEHYGPPLVGADVLSPAVQAVPGFMLTAGEYCGIELVGVYAVRPPFGGTSGSWVTPRAFEKYSGEIARRLAAVEGLDGVFLSLHGGMAVTGVPRPEAELVRRVKAATGGVPVAVVMDLHGNEDGALAEVADIVLAVKRFPHYDFNLMGERAARLLIRTIRGSYRPTIAARKPGVLFATVFGGTDQGIAQDVMERARRWENRHLDTYVSVFWGFTFADVPDIGAAVFVITNNDPALADTIADDMTDFIRSHRDQFEHDIPKTAEGVDMALAAVAAGQTPFVIADMADRMGDSTHILEELLRRGAKNTVVATIADSATIEQIAGYHAVGDEVEVSIGGKSTELAGRPLRIRGRVGFIGDFQTIDNPTPWPLVALTFGDNNRVLLSPAYHQVKTRDILDRVGIALENVDLLVVKSRRHFKRGFIETGLAKGFVTIDAPGHGPADIGQLPYKNIPAGIYSKFFDKQHFRQTTFLTNNNFRQTTRETMR